MAWRAVLVDKSELLRLRCVRCGVSLLDQWRLGSSCPGEECTYPVPVAAEPGSVRVTLGEWLKDGATTAVVRVEERP